MNEQAQHITDLIDCLRRQRTFFISPAFQAVSWMYDCSVEMSAKTELAYILLQVELQCAPTVPKIMETIEREPAMDQQDLIDAIVEACESRGGASVLKSFLVATTA